MAYGGWGNPYTPPITMDSPGVSKYNSAQLINQRMHELWLECKRAWRSANLTELNDILDVVWTELYADSSKEHIQHMVVLNKQIIKLKIDMKFCKNPKAFMICKSNLSTHITNKWLFLKALEKKQGIGKSYRDEFEDDFE